MAFDGPHLDVLQAARYILRMDTETASLRDFPGRPALIAAIDAAIAQGECAAVTRHLRQSLCRLMQSGQITLPACVHQHIPGHYARRALYQSPDLGYTVIAMTWGPGQGTPIHDHAGMWCVEGVFAGQLEITQYELAEQRGDDFRFIEVGTLIADTGSAGSLIPPHEYHTIRNVSPSETAVSLHVYAKPMTRCGIFLPQTGQPQWHRHEIRQLSLDASA